MKKSKKIFIAFVLFAVVLVSLFALPSFAITYPWSEGYLDKQQAYFGGPTSSYMITQDYKVAEFQGYVTAVTYNGERVYYPCDNVDCYVYTNGTIYLFGVINGELAISVHYEPSLCCITDDHGVKYNAVFLIADNINILHQGAFDNFFVLRGYDYSQGYDEGYDEGFKDGASADYRAGYDDAERVLLPQIETAREEGYSEGYREGKSDGIDIGSGTFYDLCLSVAQAPLDVLYGAFNFEILGFNLQSAIGAFLTLCLVVIIVKALLFFF